MFVPHQALLLGHQPWDIPCLMGWTDSVTPKHIAKSMTSRKAPCKPQWVSIPEFPLVNAYISKAIKTHRAYFK